GQNWVDGQSRESNVEVYFWVKGAAKSQVAVGHGKLMNAREVARWKAYWGEALGRLAGLLESDAAVVPGTASNRPARRRNGG
ncbi:MAG: hypothetical protein ABSH22_03510, partial [Tepidisphaeraceae bacterium]